MTAGNKSNGLALSGEYLLLYQGITREVSQETARHIQAQNEEFDKKFDKIYHTLDDMRGAIDDLQTEQMAIIAQLNNHKR